MDADGSGAIGSDELTSAFKVMQTLYTFICDSSMLHLFVFQSFILRGKLHACHV